MKWFLLTVSVAGILWIGRLWQRLSGTDVSRNINEDSARRRLEALMPPVGKGKR